MTSIITVKNISKKYNITHERGGYIAMRDVLTNIAKKPFSFLKKKAGEITGRTTKEEFWALKDINFEVEAGEAIGIIGANGAGKSTLLKILTGITPPTTGEIKMHGKVASLLEVGTGFHQELTGRENIFLNGAILGMTKKEIAEKFDAIVEFSGVQKFIDTPVKRYSSGMLVRLGFSVAAHMEPDILLVDEVLAVGDAEFQKKCLGKMDEVTSQAGRTILFVSHNLDAVQKLCKRCILLEKGKIKMIGKTKDVIDKYLNLKSDLVNTPLKNRLDRKGNGKLQITNIIFKNEDNKNTNHLTSGENSEIWIEYELKDKDLKKINVSIGIDLLQDQNRIALISNKILKNEISTSIKNSVIKISLKKLSLNTGTYQLTIFIDNNNEIIDWVKEAARLIINTGFYYKSGNTPNQGSILLDYDFKK